MLRAPVTRPIGGDFETVSPELLGADPVAEPPWELHHGQGVKYLESGRQALAAVEEVLRREGRRRLLLPAFFCDSMVMPFVRKGWEVVPVPIGERLFPSPSAITAALTNPHETAILHAPYFGQGTPRELADELVAARWAGARVVVDETQAPFASAAIGGDFHVGSLRKTLPLVDGAYATGLDGTVGTWAGDESSVLSRVRAEAMAAKRRHLAGEQGPNRHLALFRQADDLVGERLASAAMSQASRDLLRRLDYAEIIRRRRSNAAHLATALTELGVRILMDPRESVDPPSHMVIVVAEPRALQAALAARGVYCPIHWARSALIAVRRWPDRLLSIPIDQRYGMPDMTRVAQTIGGLSGNLYLLSDTEAQ